MFCNNLDDCVTFLSSHIFYNSFVIAFATRISNLFQPTTIVYGLIPHTITSITHIRGIVPLLVSCFSIVETRSISMGLPRFIGPKGIDSLNYGVLRTHFVTLFSFAFFMCMKWIIPNISVFYEYLINLTKHMKCFQAIQFLPMVKNKNT